MTSSIANPHQTLGVAAAATADEVRAAYLQLVRQFPPERDPDKFREIHGAYQMLCNPLIQAKALLHSLYNRERPVDLEAVIDEAERRRARLPKLVLLALGNQK